MNSNQLFITLKVSNMLVMHGYDADNKEIIEEVKDQPVAEKVVAVSRIQSLTEKYVLVTGSHGRMMYWEYADGLETVKQKLRDMGLLL